MSLKCENRLKIVCDDKNLIKIFLRDFWNKEISCFSTRMITGPNIIQDEHDIYCFDKLGAKLIELNESVYGGVELEYETTYIPNIDFIKSISSKYPSLSFMLEYYKEDSRFVGNILIQNDNIINHNFESNLTDENNNNYYSLVIDLKFDSLDYILYHCDLDEKLLIYLTNKYINIFINELPIPQTIIDITHKIHHVDDLPDVE